MSDPAGTQDPGSLVCTGRETPGRGKCWATLTSRESMFANAPARKVDLEAASIPSDTACDGFDIARAANGTSTMSITVKCSFTTFGTSDLGRHGSG